MKTIEEICQYIRRHKNTPDLHSAVIHTKEKRILLNYDYDCFDVTILDDRSSKKMECKRIPEVVKFIGTNEFVWYDI